MPARLSSARHRLPGIPAVVDARSRGADIVHPGLPVRDACQHESTFAGSFCHAPTSGVRPPLHGTPSTCRSVAPSCGSSWSSRRRSPSSCGSPRSPWGSTPSPSGWECTTCTRTPPARLATRSSTGRTAVVLPQPRAVLPQAASSSAGTITGHGCSSWSSASTRACSGVGTAVHSVRDKSRLTLVPATRLSSPETLGYWRNAPWRPSTDQSTQAH